MAYFVPCDRLFQKAYSTWIWSDFGSTIRRGYLKLTISEGIFENLPDEERDHSVLSDSAKVQARVCGNTIVNSQEPNCTDASCGKFPRPLAGLRQLSTSVTSISRSFATSRTQCSNFRPNCKRLVSGRLFLWGNEKDFGDIASMPSPKRGHRS